MPPRVRIKAVVTGMRILSLNFGVEKSSITVAVMVAINKSISDADERRNIIKYVLMRKAKVPSSDLLNNRVVPYFIPMRAIDSWELILADTPSTKLNGIKTLSRAKLVLN